MLVQVYGTALKAWAQEQFGGFISAIKFKLDIKKSKITRGIALSDDPGWNIPAAQTVLRTPK
ncbi:hypothetical protein ASF84_27050 [Pseudomonas sp. Leaf127]|nr:hypothetical protein ASF84_27050 [Pseudomonas sp. Leaf127]